MRRPIVVQSIAKQTPDAAACADFAKFETINSGPFSDEAISALAALLLDAVDANQAAKSSAEGIA